MFNFVKIEKTKRGNSKHKGYALTVSSKRIIFWHDYMKLYSNMNYAVIYYDKQNKVVGVELSKKQVEDGLFIQKTSRTVTDKGIEVIPDGIYHFKETSKEGVDAFILSKVI